MGRYTPIPPEKNLPLTTTNLPMLTDLATAPLQQSVSCFEGKNKDKNEVWRPKKKGNHP